MNVAVLDASVVSKWFDEVDERHVDEARQLRAAYAAGTLVVLAPPLMRLEVLHALSRRARYTEGSLASLAATLDELRFDLIDAEMVSVALWMGRGLTAYDASYVALAERERVPLVTEDAAILRAAPEIAVALATLPA